MVDDGLEAVGSSVVTLVGLSHSLCELVFELGDAVLKFLLVAAVGSNLTLEVVDLGVEGGEVLLGQHSFLSGHSLVGGGDAEAVVVAEAEDAVGVVEARREEQFGMGGIAIDVVAILSKDIVLLGEAIADTDAAVKDDTDVLVFLQRD